MTAKLKSLSIFLAAFVAGIALLGGAPGGESALANYYGAIAYSPSSGAWGYSYDYGSQYEAEERALDECRIRGDGCQSIVWFRNACGALAVGDGNGYGWAWDTTRSGARDRAMHECRIRTGGCSVRVDICTSR